VARAGFLLWLALLAFGLPEVIAGTGAGWLTRPDVYILAIPLYALHFLLLCHLAIKTKRTSWPALFILGIIFGLYETWITKVVWAGYPGSDGFAMGSFGPWFGIHETIGLILFYHAVTSFLLPLALLTRLFPAYAAAFPSPNWIFGNSRWARARRVGLALMYGLVSGCNMPAPSLYLISWGPMLLLLIVGYRLLKNTDAARPILGQTGLWGAVLWLAALYVASFLLLRAEAIPPPSALAITVGIYSVLGVLFWRIPPTGTPCSRWEDRRRKNAAHLAFECVCDRAACLYRHGRRNRAGCRHGRAGLCRYGAAWGGVVFVAGCLAGPYSQGLSAAAFTCGQG